VTTNQPNASVTPTASPWPSRLARVLVCCTFPLIFVGGLVTTYDAGMSVPDWPNTYGYNLFLYPWTTWIAGPFNLFVEHGHRLLGATAGMLMISLALCVWFRDQRHWLRWVVIAAFILICAQGGLGGLRVLLDARVLARLHACLGPLFFAVAVLLVVFTSRKWRELPAPVLRSDASGLQMAGLLSAILAYLQIVAGAFVRHVPVDTDHRSFKTALFFHLVLAAALLLHAIWVLHLGLRKYRGTAVSRPAIRFGLLVLLQATLGVATYVLKYNWPVWFAGYDWAAGLVVERRAFVPSLVTTAHVAVGSLVFVSALTTFAWSLRVYRPAMLPGPGTLGVRPTLGGVV